MWLLVWWRWCRSQFYNYWIWGCQYGRSPICPLVATWVTATKNLRYVNTFEIGWMGNCLIQSKCSIRQKKGERERHGEIKLIKHTLAQRSNEHQVWIRGWLMSSVSAVNQTSVDAELQCFGWVVTQPAADWSYLSHWPCCSQLGALGLPTCASVAFGHTLCHN